MNDIVISLCAFVANCRSAERQL